jgi:hypothetical protein
MRKDNVILILVLVVFIGLFVFLLKFSLKDKVFEYEGIDKYKMTNCVYIKKGNSLENSWYDNGMEKEVVCDEGVYTYFEYENQYTILEAERFRNLLEDILKEE